MIYALDDREVRVRPSQAVGQCVCPTCGADVVRKQGAKVTDHFAHESREPCDPWRETQITAWHLYWQQHVAPSQREVQCKIPSMPSEIHRADILSPTGHVIEVQHSSMSVEEAALRHQFYSACHRGLVWIVDAREFFEEQIEYYVPGYGELELAGMVREYLQQYGETGAISFTWSHPRVRWLADVGTVFLDPGRLGDESRVFDGALFQILNGRTGDPDRWDEYVPWNESTHHPSGEMAGGAGCFVSAEEFRNRYHLHLPNGDQRQDESAYPLMGPRITQASIRRGETKPQNLSDAPPSPTSL